MMDPNGRIIQNKACSAPLPDTAVPSRDPSVGPDPPNCRHKTRNGRCGVKNVLQFFAIFTFLYLSFCTLVLRQSNRTLLLLSRSNFSKQEFISLLESNWQNFCNNFANLMIQFQSSVIMWSSLRRDLVTTRISESTNCCSEVPTLPCHTLQSSHTYL